MTKPLGSFSAEDINAAAAQQYAAGEADMHVVPGRTALLIVDMIDEFVRPNWTPYWIPDATAQAPRIAAVAAAFRAAAAPVIYLAYEVGLRGLNFPLAETRVPIGSGVADYEREILQRVAIWHELEPEDGDLVIRKHSYSGFYQTPLEAVLRNLGVTTIVVTGTMTNYCCGATAREGFWRGFDVVVASDCNSTDDAALHEAELATLRRGFARIATAGQIIEAIGTGTAGTAGTAAPEAALPGRESTA